MNKSFQSKTTSTISSETLQDSMLCALASTMNFPYSVSLPSMIALFSLAEEDCSNVEGLEGSDEAKRMR